MNERIKQVRKDAGLTLEKFGDKIGITASSCSTMESGKSNPSDQTIRSICREFNVSEVWLRTGQGSMYNQLSSDAEFSLIMESIGQQDPTVVHILKAYWHLSDAEKAAVRKLVDNIVDEYKKNAPK
jgi:transcriptional regulator with XRE-family HTH domain